MRDCTWCESGLADDLLVNGKFTFRSSSLSVRSQTLLHKAMRPQCYQSSDANRFTLLGSQVHDYSIIFIRLPGILTLGTAFHVTMPVVYH
ncbi:MAG: hypothetical protein FE78DRAFT_494803 [Acidomyces sp. 'richmondensis']|nr:MAG: hypothetical protein FE78DRAFT_494803 [Acidomyces sp. 'richmondensis']